MQIFRLSRLRSRTDKHTVVQVCDMPILMASLSQLRQIIPLYGLVYFSLARVSKKVDHDLTGDADADSVKDRICHRF